MNKRRDSVRLCFFFLSASLLNGSCSRLEKVEVINHFNQPIQIMLDDEKTSPLVPADSTTTLAGKQYIGGRGIYVTVLDAKGHILKSRYAAKIPGDSGCRSIATLEVSPQKEFRDRITD